MGYCIFGKYDMISCLYLWQNLDRTENMLDLAHVGDTKKIKDIFLGYRMSKQDAAEVQILF